MFLIISEIYLFLFRTHVNIDDTIIENIKCSYCYWKKTLLVSIYEIFYFALKFIWSSLYPDLNLKNIPKKQVYFISCLSAFA